MLFRDYEPRALGELSRVRDRFAAGVDPGETLRDVELLEAAYESLERVLPAGVSRGNLGRHLYFLRHYLERGRPEACRGDINDVCQVDLPKLEKALRAHFPALQPYDAEFADKVSRLVEEGHLDSAVRKAFVVLKERLVRSFALSAELDGPDLVNAVFGKQGRLARKIPDPERQATRDLLAGLYGVFRNRYGHRDVEPEWFEAAAVLGMVNWALGAVDGYAAVLATTSTP